MEELHNCKCSPHYSGQNRVPCTKKYCTEILPNNIKFGKGLFFVSAIVTVVQAMESGEYEMAASDITFIAIGTICGPVGAIVSGGYFFLRFANDAGLISNTPIIPANTPFAAPDNTKAVIKR